MKLSIRIENYVATINFYQIRNNMKNTILFLSLSLLVNLNAKAIDTNFSKQIPLEEQRVMMLSDNDIKILKEVGIAGNKKAPFRPNLFSNIGIYLLEK